MSLCFYSNVYFIVFIVYVLEKLTFSFLKKKIFDKIQSL